MLRYLSEFIEKDLKKKAILLIGPRQVGKTTFARSLVRGGEYLNYDVAEDRKAILAQAWRKDAPIIVLHEIHKFPK
jgi:predicted AAA+ superfamily ATPase